MSNILDYMRWRGDLSLESAPFGEVDNLVLSELSNLRWEVLWQPGEAASLRELFARAQGRAFSRGMTEEDDARLLPLVAASQRFGGAVLCDYVHELDEAIGKQFAAITLLLSDQTAFVSFRGTDGTIVGWKEDFNMGFDAPVPSQTRARDYLCQAAERHQRPLRAGGHSKGGNLAVYAAATAPIEVRQRLLAVYSNDGPGLSDEVFRSEGFLDILPRLSSFVPQSSIFGMLLSHPETYAVVYSNAVSVFQHNPYSWQVEGGSFVKEKELRKGSLHMEQVMRRWLTSLDTRQRKDFVDALFSIVEATQAKSFGIGILGGALRNPGAIRDALQGMDAETRVGLISTLTALVSAAVQYEQSRAGAWLAGELPTGQK